MLKNEPQAFIPHQVNFHNKVLTASLSLEVDVPEDTVRRDLQELTGEGRIIEVRRRALSHSFNYTSGLIVKTYARRFKNDGWLIGYDKNKIHYS